MAQVFKGVGTRLAKLSPIQPLLDEAADEIKAKAQANAAVRKESGEYSDAFRVRNVRGEKGVRDRLVENTHPASAIIEYGHFAEKKDGTLGQWVPGQFNLTRAIK